MATHARPTSHPWSWNFEPLEALSSHSEAQLGSEPSLKGTTHVGATTPDQQLAEGEGDLLAIQHEADFTEPMASEHPQAGMSMVVLDRGKSRPKERSADNGPIHSSQVVLGASTNEPTGSSTTLSSNSLLDPSLSFRLHSDPTASRIIYLDFDGHITTGTAWNTNSGVTSYTSPAYDTDGNPGSFSSSELNQIQQIWQRVAADFAPFAVDVTTQAPPLDWLSRTSSSDTTYGIRAVVSSAGPYYGSGGVSYVGSFTWDTDTPAFIYKTSPINVAETISHEVGHTLGLTHDGSTTSAYYSGHGSGEEGWAPIMGASTSQNVTTWDDGTYTGSNNGGTTANGGKGADDLYVITNYNGFTYRPDTEGDSSLNAVPLAILNGSFGQFGTIETRNDQDFYAFNLTSAGNLTLSADPYWSRAYVDGDGIWGGSVSEQLGSISDLDLTTAWIDHGSNLDLSVQVLDASGHVVATSNPAGLRAGFDSLALPAGSYVVQLDGVGAGDPTAASPTGYNDYASIGNYWLSGSLTASVPPPAPQLPTLSASDSSVVEGSSGGTTPFNLNVTLSAVASQNVILTFSTRDGTATSNGKSIDFKAISNGQLIIPQGQISGSIALSIAADQRAEPNESFNVDFTAISGALLGRSSAQITIVNDDLITGGGGKKTAVLAMASADDEFDLLEHRSTTLDPLTGMPARMASREAPAERPGMSAIALNLAPQQPSIIGGPDIAEIFSGWNHDMQSVADGDRFFATADAQRNWLLGHPGL